jgi:hypothetical protein
MVMLFCVAVGPVLGGPLDSGAFNPVVDVQIDRVNAPSLDGTLGLTGFRQVLLDWADVLEPVRPNLSHEVGALSNQQLIFLYNAYPDHAQLAEAVSSMNPGGKSLRALRAAAPVCTPPTPARALFSPQYPSGGVYDTFIVLLEPLGAFDDTDGDGATNNERCTADFEAGTAIAISAAKIAFAALQPVCDGNIEPVSRAACFVGLLVVGETLAGSELIHLECALQDALVDSAEIEAAYENTRSIQTLVHDFGEMKRVHLQVVEVSTLGCSQGFWKNHTELWDSAIAGSADLSPTYDPNTEFDLVFGASADTGVGLPDGATLLEVLSAEGGGSISHARNAVTTLLNNDASDNGIQLPCAELSPAGDVGIFRPIVGPVRRRFLLTSDEAGVPIDLTDLDVHASTMNPMALSFVDVTTSMTRSVVKTGVALVEIELPSGIEDARAFQFNVAHDHATPSLDCEDDSVVHFGTILFHLDHGRNIGMGQ